MKRSLCLLLGAVLAIALVGCRTAETFKGEKTAGEDSFYWNYTLLDQEQTGEVTLQQGDSLRLTIVQTAGAVDVTVKMEDQEPIYRGTDLTIGDFSLDIPTSGTYFVIVTGHKAAGTVTAARAAAREPISEDPASTSEKTDQSKAHQAYREALEMLLSEQVYPDGTPAGYDGTGKMEENHFAIFDINGDGRDELIIQFVTAPMAGNVETVYAYDGSRDTLTTILQVFPAITCYDNGIIKEEWSHGSGLAGEDYWPYNLYRRDAVTGGYTLFAEVNMWSKAVDVVDYKGDPYPEDIDAEGAGTVFILTREGVTETVSKSAYEAWLSDLMGDSRPLELPYRSLTEDNIRSISVE